MNIPEVEKLREALRSHDLPFVAEEDGPTRFWEAEATGNDEADFALGEAYALLALKAAKESGGPMLIGVVLRDMVRTGEFTWLEAGFLATIASAARAGAMN